MIAILKEFSIRTSNALNYSVCFSFIPQVSDLDKIKMSASAAPISAARFAAALPDLPLSSLYAKVAEISNSISHLQASNKELQGHAAEGDAECAEALAENVQVIGRMSERVTLLRNEVERRGLVWDEREMSTSEDNGLPGAALDDGHESPSQHMEETQTSRASGSGPRRLEDEELARLLMERVRDEGDEESSNGVHL